jgi:Fe2+ or Zn2+ uptake regulation protein
MQPEANVECLRSQLRELGHVYTIERENLLHAVYSMEDPYSLTELFRKAKKQDAVHAKSTIHRNIRNISESRFYKRT